MLQKIRSDYKNSLMGNNIYRVLIYLYLKLPNNKHQVKTTYIYHVIKFISLFKCKISPFNTFPFFNSYIEKKYQPVKRDGKSTQNQIGLACARKDNTGREPTD